jgi:hypothetical protein
MHRRRTACFFLGLWLGAGLLVAWFASGAMLPSELQLGSDASTAAAVKALGAQQARILVYRQLHEQARAMLVAWENAQLFVGSGFFFFLLFGTSEGKISLLLALLMFAIVLVQRFILPPELIQFGWHADGASAAQGALTRTIYTVLELSKWGIGAGLAAKMVWHRHHSTQNTSASDAAGTWHAYR